VGGATFRFLAAGAVSCVFLLFFCVILRNHQSKGPSQSIMDARLSTYAS
jgi:hypothetical protein